MTFEGPETARQIIEQSSNCAWEISDCVEGEDKFKVEQKTEIIIFVETLHVENS